MLVAVIWESFFYHKDTDAGKQLYGALPLGLPWWLSGKESVPMQETWVQYLGWDDLLEKETATHSSILTWEIPWTEEPGRLHSMGSQRVGHD